MNRKGFTVIELLVTIAIVGLLLALLVPAVMSVRSAARKLHCQSNLHQIGLATHHYIDAHRHFPGGWTQSYGPLYDLLPFVEQQPVYVRAQLAKNQVARSQAITKINTYLCPEDITNRNYDVTSYVLNTGILPRAGTMRGFRYDAVLPSAISDGLSNTAYFSEYHTNQSRPAFNLFEPVLPWYRNRSQLEPLSDRCRAAELTMEPYHVGGFSANVINASGGYNHLLPPNSSACVFSPYILTINPAYSQHRGGVNLLLADGLSQMVGLNVDRSLWWSLGTLDGGEHVDW